MKKILYIVLACASFFTACEKGTLVETTSYEKIALGDTKYSYLKFLNVTPGSPFVNFYLDGSKFSSALSSTGLESGGYNYATATSLFPDLGYATTSPGAKKLTATIVPTATADAKLEVLNTTITPAPGKYYTIFTSGVYSATNKSIGPVLMLEDIKPLLDTSKVFIRLINMYNGSPNLDLVQISSGTKVASNIAYGTASPFSEVPKTAPINAFALTNSASNAQLLASGSLTLIKGRAYTFYIRGVFGNATYPLTGTSYTTFYY